jgi:hypothetical protein
MPLRDLLSELKLLQDDGVDLMFDDIHDCLTDGQFVEVDEFIKTFEVECFSITILVGLLTVTNRAQNKLSSRPDLLARIRTHLEHIAPDRVDRLLTGL